MFLVGITIYYMLYLVYISIGLTNVCFVCKLFYSLIIDINSIGKRVLYLLLCVFIEIMSLGCADGRAAGVLFSAEQHNNVFDKYEIVGWTTHAKQN